MGIFLSVKIVRLRSIIIFSQAGRRWGFVIFVKDNISIHKPVLSVAVPRSKNLGWEHRNLHS
nr:MAG TPA: hypothetical protein [Caudoviricetes sp.]